MDTNECQTHSMSSHYGRTEIPRVPNSSPSFKNRQANLPRVLHSGKGGTRGKPSSPSATLGKRDTRKKKFAFDGNIGQSRLPKNEKKSSRVHTLALAEGDLFPESRLLALGEGTSSPSAPSLALGEVSLPRVPTKALRELFFTFLVFCPFLGLPTLFKTPCPNLAYF
jgi:hypothetical protein